VSTRHVTVVIVTSCRAQRVTPSLDSIEWARCAYTSVVLADSGSSDGTREYLKTVPWVVAVDGSPDMWWAGATNAGCIRAGADQ